MESEAVRLHTRALQLTSRLETGFPLSSCLYEVAQTESGGASARLLNAMGREIEAGVPLTELVHRHRDQLPGPMRVLLNACVQDIDPALLTTLIRPHVDRLRLSETVNRELRHAIVVCLASLALTGVYLGVGLSAWDMWYSAVLENTWIMVASRVLLVSAALLTLGMTAVLVAIASSLSGGWGPGQTVALRLPLIGRMLRVTALSDLSRTLALCLASGIQLPVAVELAAQGQELEPFRAAVGAFAGAVREGRAPGAPAPQLEVLSASFERFYRHAEHSNTLSETMEQMAALYAREVAQLVTHARLWGNHLLLLLVACIAGIAIVGSYLPYLCQTAASPLL